ncbi:MAG: deoxyribonuclease IV [Candidatus Bathyarchaeota archaeon]|nr:MAG: deoxyribonuclease IV [Candidatus Bathyarchaeota archaeon]
MRLGLHLSIVGSIDKVVDRAVERECNTLQMFSRNPRGWRSKNLDSGEVESFRFKVRESGVCPVFVHTPYLFNLASPKHEVYQKSSEGLKEELRRAGELGVPFVVTHLGSHLKHGKMKGFERIIDAINESFSAVENNVALLLENTAGTRNSMGSSFEDIKYITSRVRDKGRVGVCLDTCHTFAAGYDLVSKGAIEHLLKRFDELMGLEELKLVHLNDSKGGLGSKIDRHEHIGMGKIGARGFRNILHSRLGQLPLILETPLDERRSDVENLRRVRELSE